MKCYFPVIESGSEGPRKEITAYEVGECKYNLMEEAALRVNLTDKILIETRISLLLMLQSENGLF